MNSEYVRFSGQETTLLKRNLLSTELEILKASKNLNQYRKLRGQEFSLKIKAKSNLDQIRSELKVLEKSLPKTKEEKVKPPTKKQKQHIKEIPEDNSIESQLRDIQAKLAELQ